MENFVKYATVINVEALPMTKGEGVNAQVVLLCPPEEESLPGYLVKYENGTTQWIEKEEFESKFYLVEEEDDK